ncbi:hypothetical protein [Tuwongella immobilis]|uniref:Uncharacterized protein n=1 Tax=Tuwongella immobilis TaxID=692036 RepID=A0A6C2YHP2_9BACT|nr:hypothetical protein [Tuwongella immobilis]VIP00771.1 unnamed protein product [Tuwongella immobilis]VTR96960.1 unnamed protein product [Tuwongella immobilis]
MKAVEEALTQYRVLDAWWPIPLIEALQRIDIALCIPWVAGSILDFLSRQPHDRAAVISEGVNRAVAAMSTDETQHLLREYDATLHPDRDNVLVSYRHLVQGKQFLLRGNVTGLRTQITWALIFLGDCDYSRQTNVQFVVDNFLRLIPVLH